MGRGGAGFTISMLYNENNPPVFHNNNGTIYIDEEKTYSDDGYVPDWNLVSKYMEMIEEKAQNRIDLLNLLGVKIHTLICIRYFVCIRLDFLL